MDLAGWDLAYTFFLIIHSGFHSFKDACSLDNILVYSREKPIKMLVLGILALLDIDSYFQVTHFQLCI